MILTLTVHDPNDVVPTGPFVKKKRATKPEDIHSHEAFKNTGVHKIFIIAAVHKVIESYNNCKIMIDKVGLNDIPHMIGK